MRLESLFCLVSMFLSMGACLISGNLSAQDAVPVVTAATSPGARRVDRNIAGWTVSLNAVLLESHAVETERALELLKEMLDEVVRVVPAPAVADLQRVPLYFNPPYPKHGARAEYHPGAEWLRANGRDPGMVKGVEFTNVLTFEVEKNRMPNFALHELAHAYHDRVLTKGFGNPELQAAFVRARDSGHYDKVERHFGNGKPNAIEKSYAMTNPQEYFAESTEAFFVRNDFFPFTREDLKRHDPEMDRLLITLWGVR